MYKDPDFLNIHYSSLYKESGTAQGVFVAINEDFRQIKYVLKGQTDKKPLND